MVCPDTSPRGAGLPVEMGCSWDLGPGAGFYVDAETTEWSPDAGYLPAHTQSSCVSDTSNGSTAGNGDETAAGVERSAILGRYRMYSYVTKELPDILRRHFLAVDLQNIGIMGHSMGYGLLSIVLLEMHVCADRNASEKKKWLICIKDLLFLHVLCYC